MPAQTSVHSEESPPAQPGRAGLRDLVGQVWSPPYRRAAAWAAPVVLLAFGFALANFTLAGDDWFAVYPDATRDLDYTLWLGRWLMPVVWAVTGNGSFAPYFTLALGLALLVLAGLIAASAWRFSRPWAVFAVVTLFVVNPLFTDTLNFKLAHISNPLAMGCAAGAGWLVLRWNGARALRIGAAAGLLMLSLASYQPTAIVFVVVVVGFEVLQGVSEGGRYWRAAWRRWVEVVAAALGGVALYLVSVRISWWVTGTDPHAAPAAYSLIGGYPSTPGQIVEGLRRGLRTAGRFWFDNTALYPIAMKVGGLVLIGAGTAVSLRASGRGERGTLWGRSAVRAWVALLGVASALIPFAVVFIRDDPPMRGSVFTAVGLVVGFWAGLLLERATDREPSRRSRLVAVTTGALTLVLVLGCAFQVNKGFVGLFLSNQRDLANANRMLSVMEQMPEFGEGAEIQVKLVGLVRFHVAGPPLSNAVLGTPATTIVGCSSLACQDHLVDMLNLIGGGRRGFVGATVSRAPGIGDVISAMPSWPEPGSIRYLEGVFVIKGS